MERLGDFVYYGEYTQNLWKWCWLYTTDSFTNSRSTAEICNTKRLFKHHLWIFEKENNFIAQSKLKKHTYFPSGSVSSVHSFITLPLNFHGNLHSAFLSGLSLVVRHIWPEMTKLLLNLLFFLLWNQGFPDYLCRKVEI